jgi:hypothetical protein
MVLQYVAASFHLLSVSTANLNLVQHPNPYQQCEMPTIPVVVISKVLLPQSNIMAAFVHSHSSLFSDVSPGLQTYNKQNVTQFAVYSVQPLAAHLFSLLPKMSNCQHTTTQLIFYCLTASCDIIPLNKKSKHIPSIFILSPCMLLSINYVTNFMHLFLLSHSHLKTHMLKCL